MADSAAAQDEGIDRKSLKQIRQRFLQLGQGRLGRIEDSLSHPQQAFVTVLPLLFHSNHPLLPGFVSRDTPAGIAGYEPDRNQLLAARALAKTYAPKQQGRQTSPIRGLYLMGSLGTLGQESTSDLDIWLCHGAQLASSALEKLREKASRIEQWGATLGLQVHIFLMQAEAFRDGATNALSDESSGGIQLQLLREEFYRTGMLLAGLPPLWWLVPPEEEDNYDAYTQRLIRQRFISGNRWLDFGGLQRISPSEFYGAARWQLLKGIDTPYKSILKLMLFETYAQDWPDVRWISHHIKAAVYNSDRPMDIDALDPYWLIMTRISDYLAGRGESDRLALARRALYVKAGQMLSRPIRQPGWRRQRMQSLIESWGWTMNDLRYMDTRQHWKLDRVQVERDALVGELSRCYRLLTGFARQHGDIPPPDARELSMVGRKLYAVLERRPGKVERINPAISSDLSEDSLWLERLGGERGTWRLFREAPETRGRRAVKSTNGMIELLAWIQLNGLATPRTRLLVSPRPEGVSTPEYERIFKLLQRYLRPERSAFGALETFAGPARLRASLLFINVGIDPLPELSKSGLHLTSARDDPFSYGAAHDCLIAHVDHLYLTSWGEVRCHHYGNGFHGLLDAICKQMDLRARDRHEEPETEIHCFTSHRAAAIESRARHLCAAIENCFDRDGAGAAYLTRAGDSLYLIRQAEDHFTWTELDDEAGLADLLGEPADGFRALEFDDYALHDSPLRAVYQANRADAVDVFFHTGRDGVTLWVLDEQGCLFTQHLPDATERHFVTHQKRFFDSLASDLMLNGDTPTALVDPTDTRLFRLERDGDHWWEEEFDAPREISPDYLDLVLVIDGHRPERGDVTFLAGQEEFSTRSLDDDLYHCVAAHVLAHRAHGATYPIYITGVLIGDLESRHHWPVVRLLRLKRLLEARLQAALRELGD